MAEDLQNLLTRIQKDGVEKAEAQADQIRKAAQDRAAALIRNAEAEIKVLRAKAEQEAAAFSERAKISIQQAARDVLLSLQEAIQQSFRELAKSRVDQALTIDVLKPMLVEVVKTYCRRESGDARIDVLVSPDAQKALADFLLKEYAAELHKGLNIKPSGAIASGFRVSMGREHLEHDFTGEALTETLSHILRPHIAELVRKAGRTMLEPKAGARA